VTLLSVLNNDTTVRIEQLHYCPYWSVKLFSVLNSDTTVRIEQWYYCPYWSVTLLSVLSSDTIVRIQQWHYCPYWVVTLLSVLSSDTTVRIEQWHYCPQQRMGNFLNLLWSSPVNLIPPVLHYTEKIKHLHHGLHNKPQDWCASVAFAAGPFTTKKNFLTFVHVCNIWNDLKYCVPNFFTVKIH
jgi:hypothetical protein